MNYAWSTKEKRLVFWYGIFSDQDSAKFTSKITSKGDCLQLYIHIMYISNITSVVCDHGLWRRIMLKFTFFKFLKMRVLKG
jgi:hypothetical protein